MTLPHPSTIAEKIIRLADPQLLETGKLYDVQEDTFKTYQQPC